MSTDKRVSKITTKKELINESKNLKVNFLKESYLKVNENSHKERQEIF